RARPSDHESARSGAHVRPHRWGYLARHPEPRSAILRAADARLWQLPRTTAGAVHVRRRHASGRGRDGRCGSQRGARDTERFSPRAAAAGGVSGGGSPSRTRAARARRPRFERQLPQQRRQALIDATIECLKRYGHEGLSIRTISAQAGVSVGLINHHFPNKDRLIAAAYRHFNDELVAGLTAAVERAPDSPRARLRAFLEASFSPPNLDPEVLTWRGFFGVFRYSRRALELVWSTNGALTVALGLLTLAAGVLPASVAYVGALIVDAVVGAIRSGGGEARRVVELVALEGALVAAIAAAQRGLSLCQSLLRAQLGQRVNVMILEKALTLELQHFEDSEFYDKLTRARREASTRPLSLVTRTFGLVQNGISLV